ncbi:MULTISPECIES: ComEC/Rec2 family competence protein [unclassified Agromyces]|uniref:ComEC/Rec2 family competence protein n=1 Tax=unclassified Agromyces TaxID=2639701 RepID=UPI00301536FA
MRRHDLRLLPAAIAAWAAAWLATGAPDAGVPAWCVPAACWLLAGAALAAAVATAGRLPSGGSRSRRALRGWPAAVALAAACAGLAAATAAAGLAARDAGGLRTAAEARSWVEVEIRLAAAARPTVPAAWEAGSTGWRAPATVIAVDGGPHHPVRVEAVVSGSPSKPGFGTIHVVRARVSALPASDREAFRLRGELTRTGPAPALVGWTHPLREGLADAAGRLGGDGGALVPGLAIGDTSAVGDELAAAMTAASLTHLTAVSGANCAIVTAATFWAAGRAGAPRAARIAVALTALAGFVFLVTPESSVVRAAVMAVVVLVALGVGRAGGGAPALAVAAVVLLAADPWFSRDYGFALSICATGGLILLSGPLGAQLSRWMPRPVATVVAIPLAAQLACQPVLILLEPALPVYGVPANLLAAPAAPLATVAGLVGCLLLPLLPSVGFAALQVAWLPASWIAMLAHGVSALPLRSLPWLPDGPGALWCASAVSAGIVLARRGIGGRARAAAAAVLLVSLALPLGAAAGRPMVARAALPADWEVVQCDVGQGDAVLVRDDGATMLIDTGVEPEPLARCLDLVGVEHVDMAVITHWDADHSGGVAALAGRVDLVLHGPLDGARSARALDPLVRGGAELVEVGVGASGTLGRSEWRVLWPPPRTEPGNDASVVIDLRTEGYRAVFLGDLGEEAQERLRRDAAIGRADLVKVAHHGSADQSDDLYRELGAPVGLIGVGAENGYGHPTESLLDLLADTGTTVVRSDRSGTAALVAVEGGFRLWTERSADVGGGP